MIANKLSNDNIVWITFLQYGCRKSCFMDTIEFFMLKNSTFQIQSG